MSVKSVLSYFRPLGVIAAGFASALALNACSDPGQTGSPTIPDGNGAFENLDSIAVDAETGKIELPQGTDSLVVGSLTSLGGSHFFIALDDDPVDPAFDWDNPLDSGAVISLKGDESVRIVALDDDYRVVKIWTFVKPEEEVKSSSSEEKSSNSEKLSSSSVIESSSSEKTEESSSSESEKTSSGSVESSSSSENEDVSSSSKNLSSASVEMVSSSSVEKPLSSSEEWIESSSSSVGEYLSSSSEELSSSSFVTASSSSVEVSSSSAEIPVSSSSAISSSSTVAVSSSSLVVSSSSVAESSSSNDVYEPQLPGSDFSSWDKSFWGSTSDAMATNGSGKYIVSITVHSSANAEFEGSKLTLTTRTVAGRGLGIDGGWKMAGGFYFAGSYSGTDASSIYIADNKDACVDNCPADFSQYMTHGRPFTSRPTGFEVKYSYVHKDNTNDTYPQSSLIYVMLVSADNKVVAAGYISDTESVESATKVVELQYGSDAGLLALEYPGTKGLKQGTGDEEVASIRVMFASSALAYVADGGSSSQMKKNFRGGEGSQLILDNFKLNY